MRFGTVALIGQSNVGKSTFLNQALGERLAITSPLPQTTRDVLLGVAHHGDAQIAFLDTPGLHQPKSELGRRMNAAALEAARSTDCLVYMTDVRTLRPAVVGSSDSRIAPEEQVLLDHLSGPGTPPMLLVINKVDLISDKQLLIPFIDAFQKRADFASVVPTSVTGNDGVDRVLAEVSKLLPEMPHRFTPDTLTDRPTRFFIAEFVREQVLGSTAAEVPHAVAVSVDSVDENTESLRAHATIHVQKQGQRAILVGRGGSMIRSVGIGARERLEQLLGKRVHLKLFVRVTPRWKDVPRQLSELGYDSTPSQGTRALESELNRALRRRPDA